MASAEEQFTLATAQNTAVAQQYLQKATGDAQKAIAMYFEEHPAQDACDGCGEPIVGTRHKCTVCEDFELCDKCATSKFESETHSASHPLSQKSQTRARGWSFTRGGQNANPRGAFIANRN